mgnify:CR=1 FL=1
MVGSAAKTADISPIGSAINARAPNWSVAIVPVWGHEKSWVDRSVIEMDCLGFVMSLMRVSLCDCRESVYVCSCKLWGLV